MIRFGIVSVGCVGMLCLLTAPVNAFPIPVGVNFTFDSHDNSTATVIGPVTLHLFKANASTGEVTSFDLVVGIGGSINLTDTKDKHGNVTLTGIAGDPLGFFSGPILGGDGMVKLTTSGILGLFPSSTANLMFMGGSLAMGVTLPGDQLTGPDGNNTFLNYTTTWLSSTPIGSFSDGVNTFNIIMGQFTLDSVGRPSSWSYSLNPSLAGHMDFTIEEDYSLGNGQSTIPGVVTKGLNFQTPEPSTMMLFSSAAFGILLLGGRLRVSRAASSEAKLL